MTDVPHVTLLIPARNEQGDIERGLRAVLAQDYPRDRMEIIVIDGGSTDETAAVAQAVLGDGDVTWKVIENPVGTTPSNLNAGLALASGQLVCRVDARSIVPPEYVRFCADVLTSRPDVMVTGGAQVAIAVAPSSTSVGIARALNNRYAMGGARYRSGAASGPSDTVYLGAFRTEQLRAVGGWDEQMLSNQDYELNRRLGATGVVFFDGRLRVGYVPRPTVGALWRQYHRFGRWKVRYWSHTGDRPQRRQWAMLMAFPAGLLCVLGILVPPGHRRRRAMGSVAAIAAGLAAVEHQGCAGPDGGPAARLVAATALVATATGWVSGVAREAVGYGVAKLRRSDRDSRS